MPPSRSTPPKRGPAGRAVARSRKFGLLLLAYVLLTLVSFWLVQTYALRVARIWGYDIENKLLEFAALLVLFALPTVSSLPLLRHQPIPLRRENQLRLAFAAGMTLVLIVAVYQSRFGLGPDARAPVDRMLKGMNYLAVGTLGVFAGALWGTARRFGLTEVIARPDAGLARRVVQAHAGVVLAGTTWDKARRLLELVLALAAIVISLPISILLALAIWLQDPGPLVVAKVVVGRGGRSFPQLKLRSMRKDAEERTGPVPAAPLDRRVTRLGHLLRRTHIDELPQLINILVGQMSLVGPRPERTIFVERHLEQIPGYALRHAVRPGLAGMAQVYGDYYSTPREKLHYDLLYIRRRSLALDAKLLGEAMVLALLGRPPRRRTRSRLRHRQQDQRFRQAYTALRGQAPPGADDEPT